MCLRACARPCRRDGRQLRPQPDRRRARDRTASAGGVGPAVRGVVERGAAARPLRPVLPRLGARTGRRLPGARRQAPARGLGHAGVGGGPARVRPRAPARPPDFGRFMGRLVRLAPGIGAVEVWNEADDPAFFAGAPDPAGYAALLRAAYPAVKAADPGVAVLSTGMVGNNFRFLQDVYAAGGGGFFDAAAVHTDTACLLTSPRLYYREPDGRIGRFSFTGYREVHDVMTAHGDGAKGVWMTEIGWNNGSRRAGSCRDGAVAGTRAEGVSEKTQARFLKLAYRCLAADPAVRVALWFSLQDVGRGAGYGDHLGLIRADGSRKPAYRAMRRVRNGRIKAAGCGGASDRV